MLVYTISDLVAIGVIAFCAIAFGIVWLVDTIKRKFR